MKNLTWQNPGQLFVAQELIKIVKLKCCGIKVFEESEETERKKLSKFHRDLDETLSNAGIWFSARIFYLMLGIFLPCFAFTVFMLAWFIAR